jgi:hypothetical protein
MGEYVNPLHMTKERFLEIHGRPIAGPGEELPSELPVCLVDNGPFKAAAIVYDARERAEFTRVDDPRPRVWFAVAIELLKPFMTLRAMRVIGEGG